MNKLLFKRAELMKACEEIINKDEISELETKSYDENLEKVAKLDIDIKRKTDFIELQSKSLAPVIEEKEVVVEVKSAKIEEKKMEVIAVGEKVDKAGAFGQFVMSAAGSYVEGSPLSYAKKNFGERHLVTKALQSNTSPGSVVIPTEYSNDFIALLNNKTVVRSMNPRMIEMNNNMTIFKANGATTASWVGENTPVATDDMSFEKLDFKQRKLMGTTVVTDEFLRANAVGGSSIVQQDLLDAMSLKEDATLLRTGVSSATTPTSLKEMATDAGNTSAATDTSALNGQAEVKAILADIGKMQLVAEEANLSTVGAYILVSPRTRLYLENLVDANGVHAFPEVKTGKLKSFDLVATNQIPSNLGGGTDESEVYFVVPSSLIIASAQNIILSTTREASLLVGAALVNMFSNDTVGIKATLAMDFQCRYPAGVYYLSAVKWA